MMATITVQQGHNIKLLTLVGFAPNTHVVGTHTLLGDDLFLALDLRHVR